jgi:hypothetical protein
MPLATQKTLSEISSLAYAPGGSESFDSRALETSVYHHLLVWKFLGGTFFFFLLELGIIGKVLVHCYLVLMHIPYIGGNGKMDGW